MNKSRVAVVVPCYNESKEMVTKQIKALSNAGYFLVLVDDGSINPIWRDVSDNHINGVCIRHSVNLGQGAALETGFSFVRTNIAEFDAIATFDADGQHQVDSLDLALEALEERDVDIVLGSRFLENKSISEFKGGSFKYFILRFAAKIARISLGIKVTDRHNGLRAIKTRALQNIKITQNGFGHADEILRMIKSCNLKFSEVQTEIEYSQYSKSKGQPILNAFQIVFDRFMGAK